MQWIWMIPAALAGYLIGSVNTAILVGRLFAGDDIRTHGSGNAGATNALRTYGKKAALLVLLGDELKAALALLPAFGIWKLAGADSVSWQALMYAAFLGAVLGHNFPLYFRFRGGKGVLVSLMAMFCADWKIGLIVLAFSLIIMVLTRYVSLGSVLGAVAFWALVWILHWGDWLFMGYAAVLSILLLVMHRANIGRLLRGEENKVGQNKKDAHKA